jgi:hypothetical protein
LEVARRTFVLASAWLALSSCAGSTVAPPAGPTAPSYATPSAWLCLPGRDDACRRDLTATEIHADGTRTVERDDGARIAAPAPKVDCFYVYPTVDYSLIPGNHETFTDLEPMAAATVAQAARFRESCALFVPLYRQVTIGTYLRKREELQAGLAIAFSDVEAAFAQYLASMNHGRPIVLLGHSQGAEMIERLLKRFFERDPILRSRLLLAMPIGGDVAVPKGKVAGGTFSNIPLCTRADETACIVAYRLHAEGDKLARGRVPPGPGNEAACVDPADVEGNSPHAFSRAYFPVDDRTRLRMRGVGGVETPFVMVRDFYRGQCVDGADGYRYLAVSLTKAPDDQRVNPIDFEHIVLRKQIGLHVLDYQLPQGDLLAMVARRAALLP